MSSILDKTEFTQDDILEIISSKLEESINIEFKSAGALSHIQSMKKEISKDVSAFANSDGGLIFYGIEENNHVASSVSYIDGNDFTKEWLENVITSTIQKRIENLKIIPVRFDDDMTKTVYVVKVPKSPNRPHINGDKKFYRRYNFQSVAMEEYEVRDSYFKISESRAVIDNYIVKMDREELTNDLDYYNFKIEVHVGNDGNFLADKYKIVCIILNSKSVKITTNTKFNITHKADGGYKISSVESPPIFPNESLNVLEFDLEVPRYYFNNFIENTKFEFYLHSIGYVDSDNDSNITQLIKELVDDYNLNQK
jgi:hypothetical protein